MRYTGFFAIIVIALLAACNTRQASVEQATASITKEDLARHVQVLASDEFEGRAPASRGEEKTINYLIDQFKKLGMQPGNGDSYLQEVPLVEITADDNMQLVISGKGKPLTFKYLDDFVAGSPHVTETVSLKRSPLVFVGYGIVAPEYGWNDYAGLDVTGKTVVVLVNDPGYATGDSTLFRGKAMTYYGRWTYKYEEAARQGAAGVLIVHQTGPAGYPWTVVRNSWSGPQFYLQSADSGKSQSAVQGWITLESARQLFQAAGQDFDVLQQKAARKGFRPVPLPLTVSITIHNTYRFSKSYNVIARYPGKDRAEETIIYTAHWDHFGINPTLEGDTIMNGARDNATGTAALLELAEAFSKLDYPTRRSVVFLAVTAEEQGLLGSAWYATHPIYPLNKTVANINMDAMNIFGPTKDITVIGLGYSELDDVLRQEASAQGRYLRPDPEPEKGYYFRSDHFSFAKQGVPALYAKMGVEHTEKGEQWMRERVDWWVKTHYHKPSDEYDPSWWDLRGMEQNVRLLFRVGYRLADSNWFPNWREGTEFRAKRDAMMQHN